MVPKCAERAPIAYGGPACLHRGVWVKSRMRLLILPFALSFAAISISFADAEDDFTVSTAVGFESRYVFRGAQIGDESLQPAVTLAHKDFYGGVWFNLPLARKAFALTRGAREMDVLAGYNARVAKRLSIDVGATYYTYPALDRGFFDVFKGRRDASGANTLEPYLGVAFDGPLSPKLYIYRDVYLHTSTAQGSLSHSIALGGRASADFSASLGYVDADRTNPDYLYGQATAGLSYQIARRSTVYAGLRCAGSNLPGGAIVQDRATGATKPVGVSFGVGATSSF
ncbi:MAG TPA: TorF family putative porin [Parvularculaceae bacterium]|nr:TorF family putative porin [Parvularculaceae bacterium]